MIGTYSYPVNKLPIIEKFQDIARREGIKMSPLLIKLIEEYVNHHADGNPNFTLDQFHEKDFKACPALFRNRQAWENYYKKITPIEYKELDQQLNLLLNIHNKNIK